AEKSYLWLRSFEIYEEKLSAGKAPKKLKRALLDFLARNASLLVSAESFALADTLRRNFDRKYTTWVASGRDAAALGDKRPENSGRFRSPELSEDDRDKLIAHAVMNCGGRVAQAWRELNERRELSESILSYYLANPSSKSYVPRRISDSVKHEVAMLEDIHHGPRQAKLNGAHISRDWSTVAAGDWFQADDGTMPIYYWVSDGNGWFQLMRGQVLLMIDLRTTRILGFVLISERNYNANAIRTLVTKVADTYGLPRKGFYFENGIWRARIIKGVQTDEAMSWGESEMGLREFGLKFVHARLPRAKPVEGIMNATQNLMEGLPGYVGRDERHDKFERVQKQILQVNARKLDPRGLFMSEDEWIAQLENLCERFNAARNDGKMTCGLSPNEAFETFQNRADPPIKFSASCRYLLAHHRRPVNVTANGITLRFGKNAFNYRSAETGKLIGQRVFAWFNPETPEILTVPDTRRENPFTVARSQDVPAMEAPAELMAQEMERINAHQSFARARYRVLKATYAQQFRPMIADRDATELGAHIDTQRTALETAQRQTRQLENKGRNAARKIGMALPAKAARRPESVEALEELTQLLDQKENES
ncbi:MAG TPA: hypothetical protein VFB72_10750, partial [Verrucomicrobiae bacterium]|nr:hypothetical protein [Verrucomicrobiae bacterium]